MSFSDLALLYKKYSICHDLYTAISQLDNVINKFIICLFEKKNNDDINAVVLEYSDILVNILFEHPNNEIINKQIHYINKFISLLHTNTNYVYKYYFTLKCIDLRLGLFLKYNISNVIENIIYEFNAFENKIDANEDWIIRNELIFSDVISLFDKIIMKIIEIV